ncbi:MAG: hypothetical protein AAF989_15205, partial [Planctomycetota bacterium]
MKVLVILNVFWICIVPSMAIDVGKLVFKDEFDRNESQEITEEIGRDWSTSSESRAGGHKQEDLNEFSLHITKHVGTNHPVSLRNALKIANGEVRSRFKLPTANDQLGVDFADTKDRRLLGGHTFKVSFRTGEVVMQDMNRAKKNRALQERKKTGTLSEADRKSINASVVMIPIELAIYTWHNARVRFLGDQICVHINKKRPENDDPVESNIPPKSTYDWPSLVPP